MTDRDIAHLIHEAEAGHGGALLNELRDVPFDETLKILKAIEQQNQQDRRQDRSISTLHFEGSIDHNTYNARISLYWREQPRTHWWQGQGVQILSQTLNPSSGAKTFESRDK